jgi:putative ABC transport system permease protein
MNFLFRLAWQDSRKSRSRLLLFMSSIILGIAALVAINSFSDNLQKDFDNQTQELLGADLVINSGRKLTTEELRLIDSIGKEKSEEWGFASVVSFPESGGVRLVQVKAIQGNFPYYGKIETTPTGLASVLKSSNHKALIDKSLVLQFAVKPGDSVKLGNLTLPIAGSVDKIPGQSTVVASVAPAVYIPLSLVNETGLVQFGSRINYRFYFKFPEGTNIEKKITPFKSRLDKAGINYETIANRKQNIGKAFENLTKFLNLTAFIALLLGCVGVASAVNAYIREKISAIAVLRCLGMSGIKTFLVFLIQIMAIGLIGAIIGALLGSGLQFLIPWVLKDFLPIEVSVSVSWKSVFFGIGSGLAIAVLFAILPLLPVRRISPLRTLRSYFEENTSQRDWLLIFFYISIPLIIAGFAYLQVSSWRTALGFTLAVLFAFLLLTGVALLLMWIVKRFFPSSWSYVWRQSLANLYRPHNQTLALMVSIGLGTGLITTLYLSQNLLLRQVSLSGGKNQPNVILFDIQNEQKQAVAELVKNAGIPVSQIAPIVPMRLVAVNGKTIEQIQKDTTSKIPTWAMTREYRMTYRNKLIEGEKISKGKLYDYNPSDKMPVRISVDEDYLRRMSLKIGDTMTFNVQGLRIETIVGSTRKVEWGRFQSNFLVVFPEKVLEKAPQSHVLLTRIDDEKLKAGFQQKLIQQFPNVSFIDLGLIISTLDEILAKIAFVLQFMALFSIVTGLIVLAGSVIISRYQRIQENVLLRTLGASRKQIVQITLLEYLYLGIMASLSGILLAMLGTWALAYFVFETAFVPVILPVLGVMAVVTLLTILIGWLNSRNVLDKPPLEILRTEV